ncbi:hypothetical protein MRB53_037444 [Persea americana]|nr:hypothetical protein MRB53_037444 [Persea americana]
MVRVTCRNQSASLETTQLLIRKLHQYSTYEHGHSKFRHSALQARQAEVVGMSVRLRETCYIGATPCSDLTMQHLLLLVLASETRLGMFDSGFEISYAEQPHWQLEPAHELELELAQRVVVSVCFVEIVLQTFVSDSWHMHLDDQEMAQTASDVVGILDDVEAYVAYVVEHLEALVSKIVVVLDILLASLDLPSVALV